MEPRLLSLFKEANNVTWDDSALYCSGCHDWLTECIYLHTNGYHYCITCNNSMKATGIRDRILEDNLSKCHYPCKRIRCSYWLPRKSIQHHMRNCCDASVYDQLLLGRRPECPECKITLDSTATSDLIAHFDEEHALTWNYGVMTLQVTQPTYIYANDTLCRVKCRLNIYDASNAIIAFVVELVNRTGVMTPWSFVVQLYDKKAKKWSDVHLRGKISCPSAKGAARMALEKKDLERFMIGEFITIKCCIIGD